MRRRSLVSVALISGLLIFGLVGGPGIESPAQSKKTLYGELNIFSRVIDKVQKNYVEEVSPEDLIEPAIEGMLQSLDPHSTFLDADEYKELQIGTRGEFGGLGIRIGIRDEILTVISPLEGTPAYRIGILAGDRIVEIEGKSTRRITLEDAVKKLRGKPGTEVTITIHREGVEEPLEFTITRAVIKLKAVPYYGMLKDDIGYVRLANFSRTVGSEFKAAIDALSNLGIEKLILDLRGNTGGLLPEAVEISDYFLEKGRPIVSTKGRNRNANNEYQATRSPICGDRPLVVLVDRGSASASEIVAGAIQDYDKGLILGTLTFGKGSVQNLIPLQGGTALKLTTAKWYTPSGRCIDKGKKEEEQDEEVPPDTFYTSGKRVVYGGGGITPDFELELPTPTTLESRAAGHLFEFAVSYTASHKDIGEGFEVSPEMLGEFKDLLREKEVTFTDQEFSEAEPFIKKYLKAEIAEKLWGTTGRYEALFPEDPLVQKALELLSKSQKTEDVFAVAEAELKGEKRPE